jgi:SOS-response transcriptional repressor LexA
MDIVMHYASPTSKCLLHHASRYLPSMGASERLKEARERAGYLSAKSAAEAMGVPVATYIQHENGSRGVPPDRAARYGRFFRVAPEWLLFGKAGDNYEIASLGPRLYVKGEVAAGVWREAWEYDADEWEAFTGRADIKVPLRERFGLRIFGDSMGEVYPPGTIVECVQYHGDEEIPDGKRVIVQRTRSDGHLETTVKELQRDPSGRIWLRPRSSNPMFQAFPADEPDSPDIVRIEIIGVVVSSIRPE